MMDVLRSSTLMVLVALCLQRSRAQGTSQCMYSYEEQPRTNLECNPYPNPLNELRLTCEVVGPNQLTFSIGWNWEPLINPHQTQRLSSRNLPTSKYILQDRSPVDAGNSQIRRISRLRVQQLNDSDAGRYFCQVELSNGTLLTPSNKLLLSIQSVYTNLSTCQSSTSQTTTSISCANVTNDSVTVQPTTGNTETTTESTTDARTVHTAPSDPTPDNIPDDTPDDTPVPTSTFIPMVPELESGTLPVALYIVVPVIVIFCAITVTLAITIVILYRKKSGHANFKKTAGTSAPYYSYPSPQTFPLHESADGDYIDPSAASPPHNNLTPEAANTEMGPPDERKEVYQSLNPTSVDYTSLYMTTDMQGRSVVPTVQEGGREYVIVDRRKRDPPNLYATVTTN